MFTRGMSHTRDHSIPRRPFLIGGPLESTWIWIIIANLLTDILATKPLSLTLSEIFNVECEAKVHTILIRPLNKV